MVRQSPEVDLASSNRTVSPAIRKALDFAYRKPPASPKPTAPRTQRSNSIIDAIEDLGEVLQLAARLLRAQRTKPSHEETLLSVLPAPAGPRRFSATSPGTQVDGGPGGQPDAGPGTADAGPGTGATDGGPGTADAGPATGASGGGTGTADAGPGTGAADGGTGTADAGPGTGAVDGGPGTGTGTGTADAGPGTADAGAGTAGADAGTVAALQEGARELVSRHEGSRSRVYDDSAGHPTVGIGFNLDRADARTAITNLGVDYDALRSGAVELTDQQVTQLFDRDLNQAVAAAERTVSNFNDLPANVQLVVVDMVFNLGEAGFSRFANAIEAIEARDFQRAATEMQDSAWYRQTGTRAQEDVRLMEYQANDGGTP